MLALIKVISYLLDQTVRLKAPLTREATSMARWSLWAASKWLNLHRILETILIPSMEPGVTKSFWKTKRCLRLKVLLLISMRRLWWVKECPNMAETISTKMESKCPLIICHRATGMLEALVDLILVTRHNKILLIFMISFETLIKVQITKMVSNIKNLLKLVGITAVLNRLSWVVIITELLAVMEVAERMFESCLWVIMAPKLEVAVMLNHSKQISLTRMGCNLSVGRRCLRPPRTTFQNSIQTADIWVVLLDKTSTVGFWMLLAPHKIVKIALDRMVWAELDTKVIWAWQWVVPIRANPKTME